MLTLSEDAPLVAVAVGERDRVEALAEEIRGIARDGLLALNQVTTPDRVRSSPRIATGKCERAGRSAGGRVARGSGAGDDLGAAHRARARRI